MTTNTPESTRQAIKLAEVAQDVNYIKKSVDTLHNDITSNYVTKEEFKPVKQVVYGIVGLVLTGVLLGILSIVVYRK